MLLKLLAVLSLAPVFMHCLDSALNDDVLALIVFKADLKDPQSKLESWNEDDNNACNWVGVKCNPRAYRVSELVLDSFSLSGHIGRSLLRLRFLTKLSLSKNNFAGTLNPILSQIKNLQILDLSENSFSGPIPEELFLKCGPLRAISLAKNNLTGPIPDSLNSCLTLEWANFSSNQLSGSLPSEIWSLSALRSLDLSENFLEGDIPRGIGSLYDLRAVNLSKNRFTGKLPEDIGGCLLLKSLDISENFLSGVLPRSMQRLSLCNFVSLKGNSLLGVIPDWIGDMTNVEFLDLGANNFTGWIPDSIGHLQSLKELHLSNNQLTGNLPGSLTNCSSLVVLDVSHNMFTGNFPGWTFKLSLKIVSLSMNSFIGSMEDVSLMSMAPSYLSLEVLDVSSNALSGEIPSLIGNFSSLQVLNMSRNSFIGSIPASIGELDTVQSIDLSDNQLNGSIPPEIGGAVALQELRLERNFLTGVIPTEIEKCSSLTSLVLFQNKLTGSIPAAIANLTDLQVVDLSFNQLSGNLPKELTNLSHLLTFNISHNHLEGELPVDGFFNTIPSSSVADNPSLCGSAVNHSCPAVHTKPIVLNPNSSSDSRHGSFSSSFHHKKIVLSVSALIAIGAAVFIALGVVIVTVLNLHVRTSTSHSVATLNLSGGDDFSHSHTLDSNRGKLVMFSGNFEFSIGAQALLNKDCELGRGGFGVVYRTILQDGRCIAIKKLHLSCLIKSQEHFEREVRRLGKIKHHNLVLLEGYYWTPSLQLLINEYVGNGSLHSHLHKGQSRNSLQWQQRFNVILGTAKGLAHLHKMNVIHCNLKSTNVLIDSSGDPKVGDFGLATLLPSMDRYILSSKLQSALGYMAPEFACGTVKITEKCNVYGFGVLTIEVVTGKRPVEYLEDDVIVLCDMVRNSLEAGRIEECIDKRLQSKFPVEEAIPVVKLGLICASQVPSNRPDMDEVVKILELIHCPSEGNH